MTRLLGPADGKRAAPPAAPAGPAEAPSEGAGYFPFIRVNVRHEFFNRAKLNLAKGVCDELDIQPTPQTRRRLALFGMIARCRPDGIDVVWDRVRANQAGAQFARIATRPAMVDSLRRLLTEPPLLFTVALTNPRFANFTAMPSDFPIGDLPLQLSNRAATVREKEKHSADLIIDWPTQAAREQLAREKAKAKADKEARKAEEAWEDQAAKEAREAKEASEAAAGHPVRVIDNGPAMAEREHLLENSRHFALLDLYLVAEKPSAPDPGRWDLMPISLDSGGAGRNGMFRPCTFTLGFEARRTHWRYFVATRDGSDPEALDLEVVAPGGGDAGFERTHKRRILPDGRAALCLSSKAPLPILARPERAFSLTGLSRGGRPRSGTLVDRLPAPSTDSISPAPAPGGEAGGDPRAGEARPAWSDIYVFV